jgi:phosphatidylglycerol---prolipoprotein diacylglyceryl transferase
LFTSILSGISLFYLSIKEAKRKKVDMKDFISFLFVSFISGLIFSRLFYFLFYYNQSNVNIVLLFFNFSKSGLTSFGGFFGGTVGVIIFYLLRRKKVNIWKYLDIVSIGIMLGLVFGRVGCFFAGCCYGKEIVMNIPWAIQYKDALRHPTQLYDLLNALFVFIVLQRLKYKKLFDGSMFLIMLFLYSFIRIVIEFFRVGHRVYGFTSNQYFYFVLLVVSLGIYFYKYKKKN